MRCNLKYKPLSLIMIICFTCGCVDVELFLESKKVEILCVENSAYESLNEKNQEIGLFITEIGSNSAPLSGKLLNNSKFILNDNRIFGDPIYLETSKKYIVESYYPYTADVSDNMIKFLHNDNSLFSRSYFPDKSSSSLNKMNVVFEHVASQVEFEFIDSRDSVSKACYPFSNLKFSIKGFCGYYYYDYLNNTITKGPVDYNLVINEVKKQFYIAPGDDYVIDIDVQIMGDAPYYTDSQIIRKKAHCTFNYSNSYLITINIFSDKLFISKTIRDWIPEKRDDLIIYSKIKN